MRTAWTSGRPGRPTVGRRHPKGRDVQSHFDDELTEIGAARRFAERVVGAHHTRIADVLVVVSELASNAIRHAHTGFSLRVCDQTDHVRIEVADHGAGWPVPRRHQAASGGGGMGLSLVEALSDRWGATEQPGGKVVWAELDGTRGLRFV
jgi:anti-sigma regulatory factor (Ser/Thr protein kinase)